MLGREVTKALATLGEVQGSDVEDMDVTDLTGIKRALGAHPPDVVVHLAALKGNLPSRERPLDFFNVNTMGTLNMLEACRELGVKKFIFFSSLTVYGPTDSPVDESTPLNPLHMYSGSKGASESLVHAYCNAYGMAGVIFRPNFIVGPIPAPLPYVDNLVYDFIEAAKEKGVIELAGDGQFQREWLHPRDVAAAVALGASSTKGGCETYILSDNRVTMHELASRITRAVGAGSVTTNPSMGGFSIISSSEKARRELGWKPQVDLDSLIAEIWHEYQSRS